MSTYPGTIIEVKTNDGKSFLDGLFIAGNIFMGQISALTSLGTPTLQNWVNRGFLSRPKGKKYNKNQLARILIINSLRKTMKLEDIQKLLIYVNGDANDESDNIIEESTLYCYICDVVFNKDFSLANIDSVIETEISNYNEKYNGAKSRLKTSLNIICKTYIASSLLLESEELLQQISNVNIFGKKI